VFREPQDIKEKKVKYLSPTGKWAPLEILGLEDHQGEKAWMELLELQD
jgi:hypothetical protein